MHLAYRWFCRLDLDDQVPDHSSFSVNRHGRFRDSDILRHVFESVVRACMDAGLIKGEGFAVDASIMEADARFTKTIGTVRVAFCNAAKADPLLTKMTSGASATSSAP